MSFTHIHLLLNHFPVIGSIIGAVLLFVAVIRRNTELTKAALGLFAALGVITVIVYFTGEPAEEAIEKLPGFSETITERHEEFALLATIVLASFGALALSALAVFRGKSMPRWLTLFGLVVAIVSGAAMGYTAMLGGQVRHTEVRTGSVGVSSAQENPD